jgi:hypothetical protein
VSKQTAIAYFNEAETGEDILAALDLLVEQYVAQNQDEA